jgi:hypothetical protein
MNVGSDIVSHLPFGATGLKTISQAKFSGFGEGWTEKKGMERKRERKKIEGTKRERKKQTNKGRSDIKRKTKKEEET